MVIGRTRKTCPSSQTAFPVTASLLHRLDPHCGQDLTIKACLVVTVPVEINNWDKIGKVIGDCVPSFRRNGLCLAIATQKCCQQFSTKSLAQGRRHGQNQEEGRVRSVRPPPSEALNTRLRSRAKNYTTRNQAIKKLQISLSDFRRLCILKGETLAASIPPIALFGLCLS